MAEPRRLVDPQDPRAPSAEVWAELSESERARLIEELPAQVPLDFKPPEGDPHRKAKWGPVDALDSFFRRVGRRVYVSSDLMVYYPGEPRFSPDFFAVLDVDPHERLKWVVSAEGKGLDLVLEVLYLGDRKKDLELNVERYARLGITEYFIFDRRSPRLTGYRLPGPGARSYQPIVPQAGRWHSQVLELDLGLEAERVRFYAGTAPIPESFELAARAEALLSEAVSKIEQAERRAENEAQRAESEAQRAESEAQRAERAERELAELRAELERLRRER